MQDDAAEVEWFDVSQPPSKLAFDHKLIIRTAFEHLLKQHTGKGENCGVHIDFCRYAVVDIKQDILFFRNMHEGCLAVSGYSAAISDTYHLAQTIPA